MTEPSEPDRPPWASKYEHLDDWPDATPEDLAAFDDYIRGWTVAMGVWFPLFMLACLFVWWPIDALVAPDAAYLVAFRDMRSVSLVALIVVAAWFRFAPDPKRTVFFAATLFYALAMAIVGFSIGRLGPDHIVWLADAYIALVPSAFLPIPLWRRVAASAFVVVTLQAAYFLPFPGNTAAPTWAGQVSFGVFVIAIATLGGEVILRTVRRSFLQGRTIAREKARVDELARSLARRVSEQTVELRALAHHLEQVQEAERRRLSRDLHDELGQELTAMRYLLEAGERRLAAAPDAAPELLTRLGEVLQRTTRSVRSLILDLRPRLLEDEGLGPALAWLVQRAQESDIAADVEVDPVVEHLVSVEAKVALFRCVQEAITNTIRHANADRLSVRLRRTPDAVLAVIEDDGEGLDLARTPAGFGIIGMRERLRAVGGSLTLEAAAGGGTRVVAAVPLGAHENAPPRRGP